MNTQQKHAIVFGSSGVSGWALVNELLLDYPQQGVWSKVTALTNRPLSLETSQWPADRRLAIVSGIDLLNGSQEELEQAMKTQIPDIETVTHVYYMAYKAQPDVQKELKDAVHMLRRTIVAMEHLSLKLEFIVLQTGAKIYGFYLEDEHYFPVPLKESLPRLKQPYYDDIFYYPQLDVMLELSEGKSWTWNETRPDTIIGFVPNLNAHSLAELVAIYLSLWAKVFGKGAEVPFPGNGKSWLAKSNEAGAAMTARQTIFLSMYPETCGRGEAFNIASSPQWTNWAMKWPEIAAYFGLKGTPPNGKITRLRDFICDHIDEWRELEKEHGLRHGIAISDVRQPEFDVGCLELANFDRQYDMSKLQERGFKESCSTMQTWGPAFDRMRKAKIIP